MHENYELGTYASALAYQNKNQLEDWIHEFLNSSGNNPEFSRGLKLRPRFYSEIMWIDAALLTRNTGPESDNQFLVSPESFESRVSKIMGLLRDEADLPPLIVNFTEGNLELNDGNHRLEAYHRLRIKQVPAILWCSSLDDNIAMRQFISLHAQAVPVAQEGN